jgi:hypothetical protein
MLGSEQCARRLGRVGVGRHVAFALGPHDALGDQGGGRLIGTPGFGQDFGSAAASSQVLYVTGAVIDSNGGSTA